MEIVNKSIQIIAQKYLVLFFSLLLNQLLISCSEEKIDFYRDPMQGHDVWRLPIIEPYQLITADCCSGWNFQNFGVKARFSADSINYQKSWILFYDSSHRYGAFSIKDEKIIYFTNRTEFINNLLSQSLSTDMYSSENVFRTWSKTGVLPWGINK